MKKCMEGREKGAVQGSKSHQLKKHWKRKIRIEKTIKSLEASGEIN